MFRSKKCILLCSLSLLALPFAHSNALAKTPSYILKIKAPDRKKIYCNALSTVGYAGDYSSRRFKPFADKIYKQEQKVERAKPRKRAKEESKLQKLRAQGEMYQTACRDVLRVQGYPVDPIIPAPTIPVPPAEPPPTIPDPLTPKTGPLTKAEVDYLNEKAAMGGLPASAYSAAAYGAESVLDILMSYQQDQATEDKALALLRDNGGVIGNLTFERFAYSILINTRNPFYERLAAFTLHNLVTTSIDANSAGGELFYQHYNKLRSFSRTGDYAGLVRAVTEDPSMLYFLNGAQNVKGNPNENYGREVMELFLLGPTSLPQGALKGAANYTENDVAVMARACTGYTVTSLGNRQFRVDLVASRHDNDPNKLLFAGTDHEVRGNTCIDMINGILDHHPSAPEYLAKRLLVDYYRIDPSPEVILGVAKVLKATNYNFVLTLRRLFKSQIFYDAANRNTRTKNPVEMAVELMRRLKLKPQGWFFQESVQNAGMRIGSPKSVFGWSPDMWSDGYLIKIREDAITRMMISLTEPSRYDGSPSYTGLLPTPNATAEQVVDYYISALGIQVTPQMRQIALTYMTTTFDSNGRVVPSEFSTGFDTVRMKVIGLILLLTKTNDFTHS